ncbi:hypothetical protein K440DRAFT_664302 [Wilcoxina mikolae CBS 423.85]|nr:hypothetical protein K440DRAFT_664302 [Wilcoxina mikolae CBS 423.85]
MSFGAGTTGGLGTPSTTGFPVAQRSPFAQQASVLSTPTPSPKAKPPEYPPKPTVRLGLNLALEKLETKNQSLPLSAELSPRADMIVALYQQDGNSIKYAVESNILRLASPVFRAMLGENFKEGAELVSSRNELYTLELPDDDAKAMYTLLCILHHISQQVPTKMPHSELLHIAITSEKYDCYEALFPWIQLWLPQAKTLKDDNDALLIAWSFRYKALFEVISRVLILECPVASDGTIVTKSGGPFHETIPESVLTKILQRRNDVVDKILGVCLCYTKLYAHSDGCLRCKKTTSASQGQGCDTMMLGAIVKCLLSAGLNPENHASQKRSSVVCISDLLHGLRNKIFGFVRQNSCQSPRPRLAIAIGPFSSPEQVQAAADANNLPRDICAVHGAENMCPGATFHVECDFLPQMLREVNEIFDGVVGLSLDNFESRKVLSRNVFSTSLDDEVL